MARLDIGIGEDFPVEEKKTGGEDCASRHRHHGHHHHDDRHAHRDRWHRWIRERFSRSGKKKNVKKDGE